MNYSADQMATFPWIISEGTLRLDHLADAYLGAFDQLGQDVPEPFRSDLQQCAAYCSALMGPEPEPAWEIAVDWASDRLSELAPEGFYFGSQEGDGACFGFWLNEDWADALEHCGIDAEDPATVAVWITRLTDAGVDPDNVVDTYCGRAEGWNEQQAGADYAQQLAEETGLLDTSMWPCTCIDWADAWHELRVGDCFWLEPTGTAGEWLVFRGV